MADGMLLSEARAIAEQLAAAMTPYCQICQIAGSIRREKPREIKDVEIVAVPKLGPRGENLLHAWAISDEALEGAPLAGWIKPGTQSIIPWDIAPEGKYWRGILTSGAKLDLFLPLRRDYGMTLITRTGSAEFSAAVAGHALRNTPYRLAEGGLALKPGAPAADASAEAPDPFSPAGTPMDGAPGRAVPTPDEETAFRLLGLVYLPPPKRIGPQSLRRVREGSADRGR